jgi:hypothetical protein
MAHIALENIKANVGAPAAKQRIAAARPLRIMPEESLPELGDLSSGSGEIGSFIFEEELFNSWVVHLDAQQAFVREILLESILDSNAPKLSFIFGGAGTGKSSVLASLAQNLAAFGRVPHLVVPEGVYEMLKTNDQTIPGLTKAFQVQPEVDVILLDDPYYLATVENFWNIARSKRIQLIVGIDPSQWHERKLGEAWKAFMGANEYEPHTMTVAYRHAKGVGEKASNST